MLLRKLFPLLCLALLAPLTSQATMVVNFPFISNGANIATLADLNNWLATNYASTKGDVSIYIAPGTYTGSVSWNFQPAGALKFMAKDPLNIPVFDGCLNSCLEGESGGFFMRLQNKKAAMSNVAFQRIKIKNYVNGIFISNASNVSLYYMQFLNIGTAFNNNIPLDSLGAPAWGGYSSLVTDQSTGIKVSQNSFKDCYNKDNPLWFHAVYLKATSDAIVANNDISMISGDPIRLRNGCSNIRVTSNNIQDSGTSQVTTFEQNTLAAHNECPSTDIKATNNNFGMMFPYKQIFSQAGFVNGWANKAYLNEGMAMGQGYKVTVDPALSPTSCAYRNVTNKWKVFTSNQNTFVFPATDSRILAHSTGLTVTGTVAPYASLAKGADIALDTNMFFVACNSDTSSTCQNNKTAAIADDSDPFNADKATSHYLVRMKLRLGAAKQKILFTGGQYANFEYEVSPTQQYDADGWAVVELPLSLTITNRAQSILHINTLGAGLKILNVQLVEAKI